MLEDVAAYLTLAPLAASVLFGIAALLWLTDGRLVPVRVRARIHAPRRRRR